MRIVQKLFVVVLVLGLTLCYPFPGKAHHQRVRIHIPTKVRTVYKTKFVKIPEHHHYFHEKIKEVPKYIPVPKHYDKHFPFDGY